MKKLKGKCIIFPGCKNKAGYGQIFRERKCWMAHRWAWTQKFGPIPEGLWVLHHCDNPPCWNTDHLFLGNHQDNTDDMVSKGRQAGAVGEDNWHARVTQEIVNQIRSEYVPYKNGAPVLAKKYGISRSQVQNIVNGNSWSGTASPKRYVIFTDKSSGDWRSESF